MRAVDTIPLSVCGAEDESTCSQKRREERVGGGGDGRREREREVQFRIYANEFEIENE